MDDFVFVSHSRAKYHKKKKKKKKEKEEMIDLIDMPETDQNWSIFSK
jgi:hypothetical protein